MLSHFKLRSSRGCWTCRLRRKKCDEARPACAVCAALEITCHYSDEKPEWMDGGKREKEMADQLKAMVKAKASQRRERKWVQVMKQEDGPMNTAMPATVVDDDSGLSQSMATSMALDSSDATDREMGGTSPETDPSSISSNHAGHEQPQKQQYEPQQGNTWSLGPLSTAPGETRHMGADGQSPSANYTMTGPAVVEDERSEWELHSIMMYLDYVLPFLFPFYRPSLAESGRGWLLVLLMKNKSLFHTALSLSSYFFSMSLEEHADMADQEQGKGEETLMLTPCQEANWAKLQTQTGLAIRQLHSDMSALNARGGVPATPLKEAARCLQSIIQLLQFEVAIATSPANTNASTNTATCQRASAATTPGQWPLHLDAATALFTQLVEHHASTADAARMASLVRGSSAGRGVTEPGPWATVLWLMSGPVLMEFLQRGPTMPSTTAWSPDRYPWSTDQAALRFYTAYLVFADVVASTATGQAPRLQGFHAEILGDVAAVDDGGPGSDGDEGGAPPQLLLEEFVGCESWAIRLLGEVAALAAWKQARRAEGTHCAFELQRRASCIETRLRRGIARLEAVSPCCTIDLAAGATGASAGNADANGECQAAAAGYGHQPWGGGGGFGMRLGEGVVVGGVGAAVLSALHTRIWAQAALTYLRVVAHGFLPDAAHAGISASVSATLPLLRRAFVLSGGGGGGLRTLAWPFAVTGCCLPSSVRAEDDGGGDDDGCGRALFEKAVAGMGGMRVFGTLGEALGIVRSVWEHRAAGCLDPETWDIAACLGVLGHRALLV